MQHAAYSLRFWYGQTDWAVSVVATAVAVVVLVAVTMHMLRVHVFMCCLTYIDLRVCIVSR